MLGRLNSLSLLLMAEGHALEASYLNTIMLKVGTLPKIITDYETSEEMGRSGEGKQTMTPEVRSIVKALVGGLLHVTGKTLDTISGEDILDGGISGTAIATAAISLLNNNDIMSYVSENVSPDILKNEMANSKYGKPLLQVAMRAIGFISMYIVKQIYLKDPETKLEDARLEVNKRGFKYSTVTSIRFLKLAPDYENIYLNESKYEEASEVFLFELAKVLAEEYGENAVNARLMIREFQKRYPEQSLDPGNVIRVCIRFKGELKGDYKPLVVELVMDALIHGDGRLSAAQLIKLFYEKYPNAKKLNKNFFNEILSNLKKHFKLFIADIILTLSNEGMSAAFISEYLSIALNYPLRHTSIAPMLKKIRSNNLIQKPPTEEITDDINFEKRRVIEDYPAKIQSLKNRLEEFVANLTSQAENTTLDAQKIQGSLTRLLSGSGLSRKEAIEIAEPYLIRIEELLKETDITTETDLDSN